MDIMQIALTEHISATLEQVFAALTTGTNLWWGAPYWEKQEAYDLILEARVGGRLYECWGRKGDDSQGALLGKVVAIKKPGLLKLQGPFGMSDRAVHGVVSFELQKEGDGVLLSFSHRVVGEVDRELERRYLEGWSKLLENLKALLEKHRVYGLGHDPTLEE